MNPASDDYSGTDSNSGTDSPSMLRIWHNWLFILAAGLLVTMLYSTLRSAKLMEDNVGRVMKTEQVSAELLKLRSRVSEAESDVRASLLTGDAAVRPDLQKLREQMDQSLAQLEKNISDKVHSRELLPELSRHSEDRLKLLEEVAEQGSAGANIIPLVQKGSALTEEFFRLIDNALERERELYSLHETQRNNGLRSMSATTLGTGVLALLTATAGIVALTRSKKQTLRAAQLEIEKTRAEQSDKQKSRFLANMSHEIRTPMNAILGFTDLLADSVHSERERSYVNAIQTSGRSLLELINDILDLSRIEAGKLPLNIQPVDLREIVESVRVLLINQVSSRGVDLVCNTDPGVPPSLMLDGLRVRQILLNLVSNALKFTSVGVIRVEAFGTMEKGEGARFNLQLRVSDSGTGIAQEDMDRIFAAFEQAAASDAQAAQGTGLGLSITQRLAELMGGSISVTSREGEGSVFHVSLPGVVVAETPSRHASKASSDLNEFQPSRILVVDDIETNRDLIAGYFEGTHHELFFAADGIEAISKAQEEKPDVILMDVRMPKMDGTWARELLKADGTTRAIPVIAQTASSMSEESERLKKFFDGYLRKPFNRTQLHQALSAHLQLIVGSPQPVSKKPPAAPVKISAAQAAEWAKLAEDLRPLESKTLPRLRETLPMLEVAAFARLLHDRSVPSKCAPLREYAEKLLQAAEEFELDTVEWLLRMFHELLDSLEEEAKAASQSRPN